VWFKKALAPACAFHFWALLRQWYHVNVSLVAAAVKVYTV
jgi:hypothetical protein